MTYYLVMVRGEPVTQGSMNGYSIAGKVRLVDRHAKEIKTFRANVKQALDESYPLVKGPYFRAPAPVFVCATFYMAKPKSAPKSRLYPSVKKADTDKLTRAVLDALTGNAYDDDSQVVSLHSTKLYCDAGRERTAIAITNDIKTYYEFLGEAKL